MIVLIDNGHGINTKGKNSPDKRLLEWKYSREIAEEVHLALVARGVDARRIVTEDTDISLPTRCNRVNKYCYKYGKGNVILVSVHVNAAGGDGKWHDAGGWSAFTSVGETKSDKLAEHLYDAAEKHLQDYAKAMEAGKLTGKYGTKQRPFRTDRSDCDKDLEKNYTILYNTLCPAVLTENLFQDNITDVDYLLSEKGRKEIVDLHVDGILSYLGL